jgi:two-component system cell cycle response regulator DivK
MNRFLIVDDHEMFRSVLQDLLLMIEPDAEIVHAANGEEGLAEAVAHPPDLILLDVHMPVMDGVEAARKLRANPATKDVPVLIMTTADDMGPTVMQLSPVSDGMLGKPFSLDELREVLHRLQNRRTLPAESESAESGDRTAV